MGHPVSAKDPDPWDGIGGVLAQLAQLQQKVADLEAELACSRDVIDRLADRLGDGDGGQGEGYAPIPPPRWWTLQGAERADAIARLRSWTGTVFRPGYGHLAAKLPACWERHEVCLYWLDVLSEMHTYLYQDTGRSYGVLAQAAEWHSRHLPAAAACFDAEAAKCDHIAPPVPAGADPWAATS
jgi:hypothetical protein